MPNKALLTLYATMTSLCFVGAVAVWLESPCFSDSFLSSLTDEINLTYKFLECMLIQMIFVSTLD